MSTIRSRREVDVVRKAVSVSTFSLNNTYLTIRGDLKRQLMIFRSIINDIDCFLDKKYKCISKLT